MVLFSFAPARYDEPDPELLHERTIAYRGALAGQDQDREYRLATMDPQSSSSKHVFKEYSAPSSAHLFAERLAYAFAPRSAPLSYRIPLGDRRFGPAQRAEREARLLDQWGAIGIDAPRVIAYDESGMLLERPNEKTLAERLAEGTISDRHIDAFIDHVHTAREAAYYIDDPSYLHNDLTLANALGSDDGRVWLVEPNVITKQLPTRALDAALSIAYLADLQEHTERNGGSSDETDELSDRYLSGVSESVRALMRARAKPVGGSLLSMIRSVPAPEAKRYAQWLSQFDDQRLKRVIAKI